ncbi:class I SAM-dependent methyltransferase [Corynebacterium mendelii]|uniref:class I SAM-dependent methyltransferase n=1 Tax=Corynebacterium mendelii TaxID=2765362 RepID=UPI002ED36CFC
MPDALPLTRAAATLTRSLALLRSYPDEQNNPERFYRSLAEDTAGMISRLCADTGTGPLAGKTILDVGGGPGYFRQAFAAYGAGYLAVEPDQREITAAGLPGAADVRATGQDLPFADATFDVSVSSNVVEHTDRPWQMLDEMLRVTRPGGLVVVSYTVWLGPFGGHETGLLPHYIGGDYARRRYQKINGHPPKNVFGHSLFAVSAARGIAEAKKRAAAGHRLVGLFPRYHPGWAWWVTAVPLLREFAVSNLVIVMAAHDR